MSEESKKTLYILTNAGGWADDVDEEADLQESSKSKGWDKIEKPEVVPIGTSDFEISGGVKDQPQEQGQRRYQNDGQRNNRGPGTQRHRNENGKPGYFSKDRRGGYKGERRQNGRTFEDGSKWERRSNNNKGSDETRTRKPLVLAPRTVSDNNETSTNQESKESPFGLATPKVTGKELPETNETTTSETQSEQQTTEVTSEENMEKKPRNFSRNFGSSSNSSPFGKRRNNNQNKRYNNDKKMTQDGFQIQSRNRGNRSDYKKNRFDNKKNTERETEVSKPATIDVNTRNPFSVLSED